MDLRPATPDDAEGIRRLLASTYTENPKTDPDVMRWQYEDNPSGRALCWVWDDDGDIVCHSARLPVRAQTTDGHTICGLGVDAATAPSHRRRGLYAKLRTALHADCRDRGIDTTLLFLGASSVVPEVDPSEGVPLRTFVLPLGRHWLAARLRVPAAAVQPIIRALRPATHASAREITGPPDGLDDLWASVRTSWGMSIAKDADWWRWRYGAHPRSPYRFFEARDGEVLTAAAVTTVRPMQESHAVCVLDLLARTRAAARAVVGAIVESADDAPAVAFIGSQASAAEAIARRAGLRRLPHWMDSGAHALGVWDTATDRPRTPSGAWCITWGDADYL